MSTSALASEVPGSLSPADGAPLEPVTWSSADDVAAAVATARAAQPAWAARKQYERNDTVRALARKIVEKRDEVAAIASAETGRSKAEFLRNEVIALIPGIEGHVRAAADALADEPIPLSRLDHPGKKVVVEAVPRGVVGIVAPWNYPLMNFFKSLFPALLAGNGVVLKPSEWTPRTGAWLAKVCDEVLPKGLVTLVQGGGDVGEALIDRVDAVVFTGSVRTGKKVAARAGGRLVPCSVELGGKDAAIVLADCDLERTVAGVATWGVNNAGQDCSSIERVYVEQAIADAFVDRLAKLVGGLKVGPADGPVDLGPLQNEAQLRIVEEHVQDALAKGAVLRCGGQRVGRLGYQPTVLDRCTNDMLVMREETFGPVLPICRVADAEEAVRLANDSHYGLGGSVWTKDVDKGAKLVRRLDVGLCWVNNHCVTSTFPDAPWTGTKDTGTGVAQSRHAYGTFVRRRTVLVDTNKQPDAWWLPADADLDAFVEAVAQRTLGSLGATFRLLGLIGKRVKTIRAAAK